MVRFSKEPINPADGYRIIETNGPGASGSIVMHYSVVKAEGKNGTVTGIEYGVNGDVEENLEAIAAAIKARWQVGEPVLIRRNGRVGVGEIISLVAVSSLNSKDSFAACRFGLDCLKQMPTILKREIYE
jgi:molybdopterin synthase catalytic subunit